MAHADERPPVWVGHVMLQTPDVKLTREFMIRIGMREIQSGDDFAVLELRGGTHLVLVHADAPAGGPAYFDLMVDDIDSSHARFTSLGLAPSGIESGDIHRHFTVASPSGHTISFNSSHVSSRPV